MTEHTRTDPNETYVFSLTALQVFFATTALTLLNKYWLIVIPSYPNAYFETLSSAGLAVFGSFVDLLYIFFRRREIPSNYNGLIIFISTGIMIIANVSTFIVVLLKLEGRWPSCPFLS